MGTVTAEVVVALGPWTITLGVWAAVVGIIIPELLKPRRFGRIFGLTERTIREWIATRKIEVIKVEGSVRIPATEVERLIREGRRPAVNQTEPFPERRGKVGSAFSEVSDPGANRRAARQTAPRGVKQERRGRQ